MLNKRKYNKYDYLIKEPVRVCQRSFANVGRQKRF